MHAISSYRGNRPTNKQTHRQDRLQYTAPQLARSVIISLVKAKLVSVNNCHAVFVMAAACGTMTNYSSHIHTAPVAAGQCLRVWRQQLPPANDSPGRFMWLCPTLSLFIGLCMSQWERYKMQDWKMTYEISELERRHGIYWKAYMYRSMSFIQSYGYSPSERNPVRTKAHQNEIPIERIPTRTKIPSERTPIRTKDEKYSFSWH